jgi:hypothetical protein
MKKLKGHRGDVFAVLVFQKWILSAGEWVSEWVSGVWVYEWCVWVWSMQGSEWVSE